MRIELVNMQQICLGNIQHSVKLLFFVFNFWHDFVDALQFDEIDIFDLCRFIILLLQLRAPELVPSPDEKWG